jgi:ADP-ribose pyrophosphatase
MKKIPDHAKKVFEGVLHDIYHWEQEMFDGTFATFEAIKRRDAVTVIAISQGKILLNHEEHPYVGAFLTLPGGNSETTSVIDDAKRELLEETGYESDDWNVWFSIDILKYEKMAWNNNFFIAKNAQKTKEQQLDSGEKVDVKLITFDEFLELRKLPSFRNKDLIPHLEKAANSEEEKQKLKDLLGITN